MNGTEDGTGRTIPIHRGRETLRRMNWDLIPDYVIDRAIKAMAGWVPGITWVNGGDPVPASPTPPRADDAPGRVLVRLGQELRRGDRVRWKRSSYLGRSPWVYGTVTEADPDSVRVAADDSRNLTFPQFFVDLDGYYRATGDRMLYWSDETDHDLYEPKAPEGPQEARSGAEAPEGDLEGFRVVTGPRKVDGRSFPPVRVGDRVYVERPKGDGYDRVYGRVDLIDLERGRERLEMVPNDPAGAGFRLMSLWLQDDGSYGSLLYGWTLYWDDRGTV